jgi:hypothetical protein
VILDNGRIVGTWEVGAGSTIVLRPFGKLAKPTLVAIRDHVERRYQGLLRVDPQFVVI